MLVNDHINALNSIFKKYQIDKCWHMPTVYGNRQAKEILSMYGGMGSISDIYICKTNKNPIEETMEQEVNSEVACLLDLIYKKCEEYAIHVSRHDFTKNSKSKNC
ncbi:hypothetical protein MNBD_GAMMA12-2874 [hydrothermal vent metagenome]|uniref:DUF6966 domain-containing protein n=1 Tax=hydrothermal vent metagenome TaxID=652676 RepID=A0A3B0Z294_9ZZZZ